MKSIVLALLIFIVPDLIFCQVTFKKTFTITGDDEGLSVIQTKEGDYLIYGASEPWSSNPNNIFLIKTGANGDSLWVKKFTGIREGFILNNEPLIETDDSGYLFTSTASLFLDTVPLTKTNKNGDTLWIIKYIKLNIETLMASDDGGYFLCGMDTTRKICLIKTNSTGHEQWRKWISWIFESSAAAYVHPNKLSIKKTTDRGFIVSGNSTTMLIDPPVEASYPFLIKTNSSGDTLWTKKIRNLPFQEIATVQSISDNRFIAGGALDSLESQNRTHVNGYVMKFDENGDTLWTKSYGGAGNQEFNFFEKTDDGGYIACGDNNPDFTGAPPLVYSGFYLVRMDAYGDTLWTKYYPGGQAGGHDILGYSVHQTSDHGFIACGVQYDSTDNGHVFLIKTDSLGNVYPQGINDKQPSSSLSPFPNPTKGMVYLNPPGNYNTFEISDLLGNVILRKDINPDNNSTLIIDLSGNPAGIYIIRLRNDQGMVAGKIVLY
jgi:hypothetical protein